MSDIVKTYCVQYTVYMKHNAPYMLGLPEYSIQYITIIIINDGTNFLCQCITFLLRSSVFNNTSTIPHIEVRVLVSIETVRMLVD